MRPIANRDLWERLAVELDRHQVTVRWVQGYSGHLQNELYDRLARQAADNMARQRDDRTAD